jgi:hypothetical protein
MLDSITAASSASTASATFTDNSAKSTSLKSTATSTGGVAMITQHPNLAIGGAVIAVAYGIM